MSVLIAAVAVVGVLCVLDLMLTLGVIRRLREHTELITRVSVPDVPVIGVVAGDSPSAFSAATIGGSPVGSAAEFRLVAFFSSSCSICPERVPSFARYISDHDVAKQNVLAVVVGPENEPPAYLARLAEVAQVSAEQHDGEIARAFKVVGYPAFCLLDADGAVLAASHDPAMLPEPVAAR